MKDGHVTSNGVFKSYFLPLIPSVLGQSVAYLSFLMLELLYFSVAFSLAQKELRPVSALTTQFVERTQEGNR